MIAAMNEAIQPAFSVGTIPVYGDLILSPMDGYSDLPFRSLARSLGSAMSYTEFINAIDVTGYHPHLDQKLTFVERERPLVIQIFDDNPERLVQAALKLRQLNPDIIDINMGCSAKCVAGRGAGAGLLRTPEKIAQIFSQLTRLLDIPITGKIRLGWDGSSRNYLQVAHIIEDNGGGLIAVHGRTKAQSYGGEADWDAIAEVKQAVKIPVIANGDVRTVADIARVKAHTACDGVMIARAAIGNPWIFSRLDRHQVDHETLRLTITQHLDASLAFYGQERGMILFRKYASHYLKPLGMETALRKTLLTTPDRPTFLALIDQILTAPTVEFA